jgi:hypothetical protein
MGLRTSQGMRIEFHSHSSKEEEALKRSDFSVPLNRTKTHKHQVMIVAF